MELVRYAILGPLVASLLVGNGPARGGEPVPDIDVTIPQCPRCGAIVAQPTARGGLLLKADAVDNLVHLRVLEKRGSAHITLPSVLQAGERVTGRIEVFPRANGKLGKLARSRFSLEGKTYPLSDGTFSVILPDETGREVTMAILDRKGREIASVEITSGVPSPAPPSGMYLIDRAARNDRALNVFGAFNGDPSDTRLSVAGQNAKILAETTRFLTVELPSESTGRQDIELEEGSYRIRAHLHLFELHLDAGKNLLRKGDRSTLTVELRGLAGLSHAFNVDLENRSPEIATLGGGERQIITVSPEDVADGSFRWTDTIRARRKGRARFVAKTKPEAIAYTDIGDFKLEVPSLREPSDADLRLHVELEANPLRPGDVDLKHGAPRELRVWVENRGLSGVSDPIVVSIGMLNYRPDVDGGTACLSGGCFATTPGWSCDATAESTGHNGQKLTWFTCSSNGPLRPLRSSTSVLKDTLLFQANASTTSLRFDSVWVTLISTPAETRSGQAKVVKALH